MKPGWIYLKKDVNTDGTARGYKFGLTKCNNRRSKEYRTENPSIVHIDDYETKDMERAEAELEWEAEKGGMLLYPNSTEWIKPECFDEFMDVWNAVKDKHHVDAPPEEFEENLFVQSPVAGKDEWFPESATDFSSVLWFIVKAFFKVASVVVIVVAGIAVGLLMAVLDGGKPKRRRRRAW